MTFHKLKGRENIHNVKSLPGPDDITRVELANGIVVLTRTNFHTPSVVINGFIQTGSILEPDEKLGLSNFTANALMRGTQKRTFQETYDLLESAGASLNFDGGSHVTSFGGRALAEDLEMLLELLSGALLTPIFPEDQVERLRAQLMAGLAIRAQDTADMASLAFDSIVYANHPYSRPEDGYTETVERITAKDLAQFHQSCYGPRGMVLALVGAVEPQAAVEYVEKALGNWYNPDQPPPSVLPPLTPLTKLERKSVFIPGKSQADLLIGTAGPIRKSSDFLPAALGNSILGQFGMMGRIGDVVREKAGLAYYAHSSLSSGAGPGPWMVAAGVAPKDIEKATKLILKELRKFTTRPVKKGELSDSQSNFIGRLPLSLESNGGVAGALVNLERFELGLDYYRSYASNVNSVTVNQVLETAQKFLDPDKLAITVAGTIPEGS